MPRTFKWTETIVTTDNAGAVTTRTDAHSITEDDSLIAATIAEETDKVSIFAPAMATANEAMMTRMLTATIPPQTILPGSTDMALMPDDSVLTVGAGGEVYSDGNRLGTAAVAKLVRVGKSVYGLGKTVPTWWKWSGSTWIAVTNFDPNILQ